MALDYNDYDVMPPPVFRGTGGGSALGDDFPQRQPIRPIPFNDYATYRDSNPALTDTIDEVSRNVRVPRHELASLVGVLSEGGDPIEGERDTIINLGRMYRDAIDQFGSGPAAVASVVVGPRAVETALRRGGDPNALPHGVMDFVNKVYGLDRELSGGGTEPAALSGSTEPPTPVPANAGGDEERFPRLPLAQPPEPPPESSPDNYRPFEQARAAAAAPSALPTPPPPGAIPPASAGDNAPAPAPPAPEPAPAPAALAPAPAPPEPAPAPPAAPPGPAPAAPAPAASTVSVPPAAAIAPTDFGAMAQGKPPPASPVAPAGPAALAALGAAIPGTEPAATSGSDARPSRPTPGAPTYSVDPTRPQATEGALTPPGQKPADASKERIERLPGAPSAVTAQGAVRADVNGGPDGVMTYIARNAGKGSSMDEAWDQYRYALRQAFIIKGDLKSAAEVDTYVDAVQHRGAVDNMMKGIAAFENGQFDTAARFLAKSHAFVQDGAVLHFQPTADGVWVQKYDEKTHDKMGAPMPLTSTGLRTLAISMSDRGKFVAGVQAEAKANEEERHHRGEEDYKNRDLIERSRQREDALKEKQLEYRTSEARRQETADTLAGQFKQQQARLEAEAEAKRLDFQQNQARMEAEAAERRRQHETDKKQQELQFQQSEQRHKEAMENLQAQRQAQQEQARQAAAALQDERDRRAHEREQAAEAKRAEAERKANETKAARLKDINNEIEDRYNPNSAQRMMRDPTGKRYAPEDLNRVGNTFSAVARNNDITYPFAHDIARGLHAGTYKTLEAEGAVPGGVSPGGTADRRWVLIIDPKSGEAVAQIPRKEWPGYLKLSPPGTP